MVVWRCNWEEENVTFKGRGDKVWGEVERQRGRGKSRCAAVGSIANKSMLIGVEVVPEFI